MSDDVKDIWVFAEQNEGSIHPVTYELLGKGRELADKLGTDLCAVLMTPEETDTDELIYRGADKVYLSVDSIFDSPIESVFQSNFIELVEKEDPRIILMGATHFGRSLAPRIAAALDTGLTADCTGLEITDDDDFVQIRPAFTGNILAHIHTSSYPKMATVRYGEFNEPDRNTDRTGEVVQVDAKREEDKQVEILEKSGEEEVNLEEANVIVSGGRGLKDPNDFELIEDCANLFGGKVGSSRPLVDEGWIDREHQVGYSGKRARPEAYFACGISGASQHLAGMKDSDTIIAINSDPSAPIFNVADYGIVGDLYDVLPKLIEEVKKRK